MWSNPAESDPMMFSLPILKCYFATLFYLFTNEIKKISYFFIFTLVTISSAVSAQAKIKKPRNLRVVMDKSYAPYTFQSDEGKLQGVLIDQWHVWETKTGIKADISAMDWSEALLRMRAGEFDVIDCIVETAERGDYFDFTSAYTTIEASIYFRKEISGITDLASLRGFPVGVKTGDQHIDKLKANGVTTMIEFENNDAIIKAAREQKINVFLIDNPSAIYLLNKMGIESEFRHSAPLFRDKLRRAVRHGDTDLLNIVSEGFAAIEPSELKQIEEKWFGQTINRYSRYITFVGYSTAAVVLLMKAKIASDLLLIQFLLWLGLFVLTALLISSINVGLTTRVFLWKRMKILCK